MNWDQWDVDECNVDSFHLFCTRACFVLCDRVVFEDIPQIIKFIPCKQQQKKVFDTILKVNE